MKLIVGLGNPGSKYENTRHSLGFDFVDVLSQKLNVGFSENKSLKSQIAKTKLGEEDIVIAKSLTYMNDSGVAVKNIASYYKIEPKDTIVICDDTYLPVGVSRIRFGGQSGGHNGLKSIISYIGEEFWRFRLGIGENGLVPLENYVLSKVPENDRKTLSEMIDKATDEMIKYLSEQKFENTTIK